MIRAIGSVLRGEGVASALRRAGERIGDAFHRPPNSAHAMVVNVVCAGTATRLGGVQVQLAARLREERHFRDVALTDRIRRAPAIHFEGTYGVPVEEALRLPKFLVSVHDFSLQDRRLLEAATAVIFPSNYLRDAYEWPQGIVIEPASGGQTILSVHGNGIAFAGNVQRHKGAHLLPELARRLGILHVFGGGDEALLRELRREPNLRVHGYYRAGQLPSLLARHHIGLVLVPSIGPESFCLVISEAWLAGVPVIAFDVGAQGERIRRQGGGWLAPLGDLDALAELVSAWRRGRQARIPANVPSPLDAARAHLDLYVRSRCLTALLRR